MVDNGINNNEENIDYDDPGPRAWGRRLLTSLIAIAAIGGFSMVVVYSYERGKLSGSEESAPTLATDDLPTRIKPINPGGMKIPDQDKKIFGEINPSEKTTRMERLLPPPEPVMVRPALAPNNTNQNADIKIKLPEQKQNNKQQLAGTERIGKGLKSVKPIASTSVLEETRQEQIKKPPLMQSPLKTLKKNTPSLSSNERSKKVKRNFVKQNKDNKTLPNVGGKSLETKKAYAIQISSLKTRRSAENSWKILQSKNRDILNNLQANIIKVKIKNTTWFRLQASPIKNANTARLLCKTLKLRNVDCFIVKP
ncbi:MAG: hypothetical protein CMM44_04840 [Rhodospirillaceae bacterium]|nr:hypothetical protein [Rhodospirillaceae bacterium]|tara:strand:- start:3555 stop:4484 length:930 start_codon:yes stop_codon:yes gene_type:complete